MSLNVHLKRLADQDLTAEYACLNALQHTKVESESEYPQGYTYTSGKRDNRWLSYLQGKTYLYLTITSVKNQVR